MVFSTEEETERALRSLEAPPPPCLSPPPSSSGTQRSLGRWVGRVGVTAPQAPSSADTTRAGLTGHPPSRGFQSSGAVVQEPGHAAAGGGPQDGRPPLLLTGNQSSMSQGTLKMGDRRQRNKAGTKGGPSPAHHLHGVREPCISRRHTHGPKHELQDVGSWGGEGPPGAHRSPRAVPWWRLVAEAGGSLPVHFMALLRNSRV